MKNSHLEQKSIYLSISGTLFLAILGLTFGLAIQSAAVMLDGFFNVINFAMALATLWISRLLTRPDGKKFQFGYTGFTPLLNLCKGLLVLALSLFAFTSAVGALFHGGRQFNPGTAVIYAAIAAFTCLLIAIIQTAIAKKTGSPIVSVDSKNWMINGFISLSVGIVFSVVTIINNTSFAWFVPYADPTIVTILVMISLPIPAKVVFENLNQLLLGAPSASLQNQINELLKIATTKFPCANNYLRMTEVGQAIYLHLYWLLPHDNKLDSIETVDAMRHQINDLVKQEFPNVTLDIIFTQDDQWFAIMNPR